MGKKKLLCFNMTLVACALVISLVAFSSINDSRAWFFSNQKVKKYTFAYDIIGVPPVVKATLGNAAGTIGAAYLDRM